MALSNELISQFAKLTAGDKQTNKESIVYGTVVELNGTKYVRIDGSDQLTPVTSTTGIDSEDRVTVMIKNHTATVTGNISDPSVKNTVADSIRQDITAFDSIIADKADFNDLEVTNAEIENLKAKDADIEDLIAEKATIGDLEAVNAEISGRLEAAEADIGVINANMASIESLNTVNAEIENLKAKDADIEDLIAEKADIDDLNAEKARIEDLEANSATIEQLEVEQARIANLESTSATIEQLEAVEADIRDLSTNKLDAESADIRYANVNFANITEAAIRRIFSDTGIIKDLVTESGTITGELVGVTLSGDLINAGTLRADRLVVKGEDGIYYKLNVNALGQAAVDDLNPEEQAELQNGLHGSNIIAKSITAEKVAVTDLVAFGATIGGFQIGDQAIYSGVKSNVNNTTRGIYQDIFGQFAVGDESQYLKFYVDDDGFYRFELSAASIKMGTGTASRLLEEELAEIRDEVTTNLRIESSRGTVFKNDTVSTVLSAVVYRGSKRITNIADLRAAMGSSAYLQWKWQRLDENTFGVISASDTRLGNNGFTFTLSPSDVNTKVTFMCELIV